MQQHRAVIIVILLVACTGCASAHYKKVDSGKLDGKIIVEWAEPDQFLFIPSETNPLTFKRSNGVVIQPGPMYTDGGSIPRPFWIFRNYSPWGYGPAFIVHDWLFVMQNCKKRGYEDWTFEQAAQVMSEVMKSMMESGKFEFGSVFSVYTMHKAVKTAPARRSWSEGKCRDLPDPAGDEWQPTHRFEVSFGD